MSAGVFERELEAVLGMFARERLCLDDFARGRTTMLTHLGAAPRLVPGAWLAHRQLVAQLALANLSPRLRECLAQAVLVEWGREFGVGRLVARASASGLPFGGSNVTLSPRAGGLRCMHAWSLGAGAQSDACDWVSLRTEPSWALDEPPAAVDAARLRTLLELGGCVLALLPGPVAARSVVSELSSDVAVAAHPRLSPHLFSEVGRTTTQIPATGGVLVVWPHDAVTSPALQRRAPNCVVRYDEPPMLARGIDEFVRGWEARARGPITSIAACVPGIVDRAALMAFLKRCGAGRVLLRGPAEWVDPARHWLTSAGLEVAATQPGGTQLGLF